MSDKPASKDFGKRRPAPVPPSGQPAKRSGQVALLVMGTIAVGTTAYTLMPRQHCEQPPNASAPAQPGATGQQDTACNNSRGSSSGSHWSRSGFFSSESASHSSSSSSSDSGHSSVSRGGFGAFAHGFSGGG